MTTRIVRRLAPALLVTATSALAQPLDSTPCSTLGADGTVENGFAIGTGEQLRELCSLAPIPATSGPYNCTWGNRYHLAEVGSGWTTLAAQPPTSFGWQIRLPQGGLPGPAADPEPVPAELSILSVFPEKDFVFSDLSEALPIDSFALFRDDYVLPDRSQVFACARLGQNAAGRFVTVDRSAGTPSRPCFTRADGAAWEPCTNADPALREVGIGAHVAPIAGLGSGKQVVPPHQGAAVGAAFVYYTGSPLPAEPPPGDNTFRFRIEHDVPSPTAAHVHLGLPGENGPAIVTFSDPASPIDEGGFFLAPNEVEAFGPLLVYFDVHSAAHPEGELRGRLIPAQPPIFVDGFESGDTSAWSSTGP